MSILAHQVRYTYAEYLLLEKFSNVKHEFWDGQMYAMGGGTPEHSALAVAIAAALVPQLRGRCRVYNSDLRVVTATGLATYPDVTVVCGPLQPHSEDHDAVTNPSLIIEVLSPSTEDYDRRVKFEHYKSLESLQQYILFSQRERLVEVRTRDNDNGWTSRTVRDGEVAELAIGARLNVRELYETIAEPTA